MALNVAKGVITFPGATGNQTYSLASNFDPKALIAWMTYETADGITNGHGHFTMGMATYDGAAVQQRYMSGNSTDAVGTGAAARFGSNAAFLRGGITGTTIDYAVSFVSFSTGATSNFVLNYTDLPATSGLKLHYLVLGGSDITAARLLNTWTSATVATENFTVNTGFGKPDLIIPFGTMWSNELDNGSTNRFMLGAAKSATERRSAMYADHAGATMTLGSFHKARFISGMGGSPAADIEADLSAIGSWPTDGYQLTYTDQGAFQYFHGALCLRGTFSATIGASTVPISGATPVSQTLTGAVGTTAKCALLWGTEIPANTAADSTHADLGGFWVGATDGTNEGMAGHVNDDNNTNSVTGRFFTTTKAAAHHVADAAGGAPILQSEADSSISGANIILSWNDIDTVAREFSYLILGEAGSAPPAAINRRMLLGVG